MRRHPLAPLIPQAHLKLKPMTIRIPSDMAERMTRVKDDAQSLGYVFDAQSIIVDALDRALERAERELEKQLEKSTTSAK